ncbi:hypothetical protein L1987_40497 [Smallanthus sonchifolius]|uniref:Uncharacterized protein n=1 Tax=Smallanthus sonchifolius TaxID=185202 RepID=A0ACB9GTW5_9ASTR|nr:hypothetical protein L1987_40497 [Smallanthus sonchifolius]
MVLDNNSSHPNHASETVISWHDKASDRDKDGHELGTNRTPSVAVESDYFCAFGITIENTVVAVPGGYNMQAVELRIAGNKAVLYGVRILGTQDTLLDDTGSHTSIDVTFKDQSISSLAMLDHSTRVERRERTIEAKNMSAEEKVLIERNEYLGPSPSSLKSGSFS